jgi:hypothetical protein
MLRAANPLTDRAAGSLSLQDAEAELRERIAASLADEPTAVPPRGRVVRRPLALGAVVAAAVIAILAVSSIAGRDGGPAPAFAAALVRFANSSPLVLLQRPGWHVVYVQQEPGGGGEMHFVRGPADANGNPPGRPFSETSELGRVAQVTWGPITQFVLSGHQRIPTGLGAPVTRLITEGRSRRWLDITAFIADGNRTISFRATVANIAALRTELMALRKVDTTTWLKAMPASVVKSADAGPAIRQMLQGIPLPPKFDAAKIIGANLTQDRYQLGAAVTGTVACMWIADWKTARAAHNTAVAAHAVAAMATAPHWPVFGWMSQQGAWPQVLISIAQGMSRGTTTKGLTGIPADAAATGLGCAQLHVNLGITHNPFAPVAMAPNHTR